jgi:hypothetical protein
MGPYMIDLKREICKLDVGFWTLSTSATKMKKKTYKYWNRTKF